MISCGSAQLCPLGTAPGGQTSLQEPAQGRALMLFHFLTQRQPLPGLWPAGHGASQQQESTGPASRDQPCSQLSSKAGEHAVSGPCMGFLIQVFSCWSSSRETALPARAWSDTGAAGAPRPAPGQPPHPLTEASCQCSY